MSRAPELAERLLFQEAVTVAERAYAPYSGFPVGAVAVGPSGRSHHGVNVENASYPAGLCAERAALAAMVVFGERRLRFVAVAAASGADCLPCGVCLQALAEFGDPEIVARVRGEVRVLRLRDLLTAPFVSASGGDGAGLADAGAAPCLGSVRRGTAGAGGREPSTDADAAVDPSGAGGSAPGTDAGEGAHPGGARGAES